MEQAIEQLIEASVAVEHTSFGKATMICCVDSISGPASVSGRLLNPYSEDEIPFADLTDMILQANDILDEFCFPQAMLEMRSFKRKGKKQPTPQQALDNPAVLWHSSASLSRQHGKQYTAIIRVMYRQHCSWQGEVQTVRSYDGLYRKLCFRSVMELLSLLRDLNVSITEREKPRKKVSRVTYKEEEK